MQFGGGLRRQDDEVPTQMSRSFAVVRIMESMMKEGGRGEGRGKRREQFDVKKKH